MKKATMLVIVAIAVFAAVTFVSTDAIARDECECWWATYENLICNYYMCLVPPGEEPTEEDYQFHFYHLETQIEQWVWLEPMIPSPCSYPCVQYWGRFSSEYDPREELEWWVTDDNGSPIPGLDWENFRNCDE